MGLRLQLSSRSFTSSSSPDYNSSIDCLFLGSINSNLFAHFPIWCWYNHLYQDVHARERNLQINICGALRDLVPFVQFKERKKHPWRSVNFSKVAGLPNRATHHISFISNQVAIICWQPFNAWPPLKGHTYLNKHATESCKFVEICMSF